MNWNVFFMTSQSVIVWAEAQQQQQGVIAAKVGQFRGLLSGG